MGQRNNTGGTCTTDDEGVAEGSTPKENSASCYIVGLKVGDFGSATPVVDASAAKEDLQQSCTCLNA